MDEVVALWGGRRVADASGSHSQVCPLYCHSTSCFPAEVAPGSPRSPWCPRCPPPSPSSGRQPSVQPAGSDAFLHAARPVSSFPSLPSLGTMLIRRGVEAAVSPKPSLGRHAQGRLPRGLVRVEWLCPLNKRQGGHLGSHSMKQPETHEPGPCWGQPRPGTDCAIRSFWAAS